MLAFVNVDGSSELPLLTMMVATATVFGGRLEGFNRKMVSVLNLFCSNHRVGQGFQNSGDNLL